MGYYGWYTFKLQSTHSFRITKTAYSVSIFAKIGAYLGVLAFVKESHKTFSSHIGRKKVASLLRHFRVT